VYLLARERDLPTFQIDCEVTYCSDRFCPARRARSMAQRNADAC
jgi:hypothetical protein